MLHETRGVVFKTIKYSDTSIIATIYTEKFGLQSYMVNGVRSSKAKTKMTLLQPLTMLNLIVYYRHNRNLQRIKEIGFNYVFSAIPFDIIRSSIGLFMIEVLNKAIREEEANPELFGFVFDSIQNLDTASDRINNYHLHFLIQLTKYLGFYPSEKFQSNQQYFDLRGGVFTHLMPSHPDFLDSPYSDQITALAHSPAAKNVAVNHQDRKILLANLLTYYELHLENFRKINSYRILESVLH